MLRDAGHSAGQHMLHNTSLCCDQLGKWRLHRMRSVCSLASYRCKAQPIIMPHGSALMIISMMSALRGLCCAGRHLPLQQGVHTALAGGAVSQSTNRGKSSRYVASWATVCTISNALTSLRSNVRQVVSLRLPICDAATGSLSSTY